jgi:hypothetical protein
LFGWDSDTIAEARLAAQTSGSLLESTRRDKGIFLYLVTDLIFFFLVGQLLAAGSENVLRIPANAAWFAVSASVATTGISRQ